MIIGFCEIPEVMRVMRIVNTIIQIIRIAVPIILMVSAMIDLVRAINHAEFNKLTKPIIAKVVAAVLVFFIPVFVRLIASTVSDSNEYEKCLANITREDIEKAFEVEEEKWVSKTEETEEMPDYLTAVAYLENIKDEAKYKEFKDRLDAVKAKIDERRKAEEKQYSSCQSGTLVGEQGQYTFGGDGTSNVEVNILGDTFVVAKTQADLSSYSSYILNHRLYQASDTTKYGDKCLGFSYMHAWGFYTNRQNYTADNGGNYTSGGSFVKYIDPDMSHIMAIIHSEISNGRPLVLQVNGNKQGTSRHFVAVIGYRKGKTCSTLTEKDLLVIDSWDGRVERMDQPNSRFMTSGAACGKDYKGYYMLYIKHEVPVSTNPSNPGTGTNPGSGVGEGNENKKDKPGYYGCTRDAADEAWYHCFKVSHNLVVPSLGPQGGRITMKVGETRSFAVRLPSECGTLIKWTRTSADGASGWSNYVTQTRTGITNTGFTWVVKAKKPGSTIVSQTVQYDAKSPSGKCAKNVKSMYRFSITITN